MAIRAVTLSERPDLEHEFSRFHASAWPPFMLHDSISNRTWHTLHGRFSGFQVLLLADDEVVGVGNTMPVAWDGSLGDLPDGVDGVLVRTVDEGAQPTVLSAMAAMVGQAHKGRGISTLVLQRMQRLASEHGLRSLIAPVRPTLKDRYPLIAMERYMHWRRSDGSAFDPWLRVHERLGAQVLTLAERSMTIPGTISQWQEWTGMAFPETGSYVVPGALSPIEVDVERDRGVYVEQNIWMLHP